MNPTKRGRRVLAEASRSAAAQDALVVRRIRDAIAERFGPSIEGLEAPVTWQELRAVLLIVVGELERDGDLLHIEGSADVVGVDLSKAEPIARGPAITRHEAGLEAAVVEVDGAASSTSEVIEAVPPAIEDRQIVEIAYPTAEQTVGYLRSIGRALDSLKRNSSILVEREVDVLDLKMQLAMAGDAVRSSIEEVARIEAGRSKVRRLLAGWSTSLGISRAEFARRHFADDQTLSPIEYGQLIADADAEDVAAMLDAEIDPNSGLGRLLRDERSLPVERAEAAVRRAAAARIA